MSVAFRRDSDEEHLEPKFEIPIPVGPNLVTSRGLAQTRAKVTELEALLSTLIDDTDVKHAQRELRYWRTRLATAQLGPEPVGDKVELGCHVRFLLDGKEREVTIVGHDEANPAADLIAFSAPLARALMHSEVGDILPFQSKGDAIELVSIEPRDLDI